MGKVNESGFTVIEVILFLAITGVLFAVLMISVGVGINQQRYLDSARAYKALIQDQYAATLNTENKITDLGNCQSDGSGDVDETAQRDIDRGTSDCVVLGRVIRVLPLSGDGVASIQTSSVTGQLKPGAGDVQSMTDIEAILAYQPHIADFDQEVTDLDWGSYLTTDEQVDPRRPSQAVIAIIRSPATGLIRVFTSKSMPSEFADIITAANADTVLSNCVENDSSALTPRMMVSIDPRIANSDGVRLDGGNNEVCQR